MTHFRFKDCGIYIISLPNYLANHIGIQASPGA